MSRTDNKDVEGAEPNEQAILERLAAGFVKNIHTPETARMLYDTARMAQAFSVFGQIANGLSGDTHGFVCSLGMYLVSKDVAKHFDDYRLR